MIKRPVGYCRYGHYSAYSWADSGAGVQGLWQRRLLSRLRAVITTVIYDIDHGASESWRMIKRGGLELGGILEDIKPGHSSANEVTIFGRVGLRFQDAVIRRRLITAGGSIGFLANGSGIFV